MAGQVKGRRHYRMKVVPHRPGMLAVAVLVAFVMLVVSIGAAYWFGSRQLAEELATTSSDLRDYQERAMRAESELTEIRERLTFVERTRLLDQQAAQNAQQLVSELRQQLSVMERDNALYRQVMGSADQSLPQLMVLRWAVMPTDVKGYFHYELDVGVTGGDGESTGILLDLVLLDEQQDGQVAEQKVLDSESVDLRYLHRLSGFLTVPDSFAPDEVRIRVADRSAILEDIEFESQWVLRQE